MEIKGIVIEGKNKGRALGFPTANLTLEDSSGIESGVYAGQALIDGVDYKSAIFITLDNKTLEVHVLGFNGNLYGKEIEVEIGKKIREVMKFKNDKELAEQIRKDIFIIHNL